MFCENELQTRPLGSDTFDHRKKGLYGTIMDTPQAQDGTLTPTPHVGPPFPAFAASLGPDVAPKAGDCSRFLKLKHFLGDGDNM